MTERQREVERIFEEVLSYTGKVLGLTNSSSLVLEPREDFYRSFRQYEGTSDTSRERGFLAEDDQRIYLNQQVLEGELFREMIGSLIAYFQPAAFVIESTEYGRRMAEERRNCLRSGTTTNPELEHLQSNASYLHGIGKYVELETGRFLQSEHGYNLEGIQPEIMKDFDARTLGYRGFEISGILFERARQIAKENDIIRASLLLAGQDEGFDKAYEELDSLGTEEIFVRSGLAMRVLPRNLESAEGYIGEILKGLGRTDQWRRVKESWDSLNQELRRGGAPRTLSERSRELHDVYDMSLEDADRVDKIGERRLSELRTLLNNVESRWIGEWRGKGERIIFTSK